MSTENWRYNSIEEIAAGFSRPEIEVVSFDLFDTLLVRPVERVTDVYELLDHEFGRLSSASVSFRKLRIEAEAVLRRRIIRSEWDGEDVTLTDIYQTLVEQFCVDPEIARYMMNEEMKTELHLLKVRKSGQYLWQQALKEGKTVIVVSDMYLEKAHLQKILEVNGYTGYHEIFISSELKKRKITGNLYREVSKILGIPGSRIFHIGDNEESDCRIACDCGWQTAWLPSTMHVYGKRGCAHQPELICRDLTNWEAACASVGIGAMRQLSANKYFDDPFRSFAEGSDYNGDPYFVGYAALGMELLALTKWLAENVCRDGVSKLIFLARDGYLPKIAYDRYRKLHPELPKSEYLHVSRRSVLASIITGPADLYDLPVDITYQTPEKLLKLLDFCDGGDVPSEFFEALPIGKDEHFNKDTFQIFIRDFICKRYDPDRHARSKQHISDYMKQNASASLTDQSAIFDMGYSGRIPAAIIHATGIHPKVYYFHADSRDHFRHEKKAGMKIRSFFDFNPYMESSLREYSYLEPSASCIGYTEDLKEIYDAGPAKGYLPAAQDMQKGALDLVDDYLEFFGAYEAEAAFRCHDGAMPFEAFIRYCSEYDLSIYDGVLIDDELWGGRRDIDLKYLIETRRRKIPDYAK